MKILRKLAGDCRGASLVEYTILVAVIATATAALVPPIAQHVQNRWTTLNSVYPPTSPDPAPPSDPSFVMSAVAVAAQPTT